MTLLQTYAGCSIIAGASFSLGKENRTEEKMRNERRGNRHGGNGGI